MEVEDILGPVFPPSARQRKVSKLPEVMEHSVTELPGRGPTMLQQMKNSHALSAGKKTRERPLSLLFGAPADSNTAISTLETPWNAALRHSSVKVNVRPSPIEHDRLSWLESHDRIQYPERGSSLLSVTEEDSDSSQEGLSETTSMNAHIEGFWAKFKVAGSALRLNEAFNSRIWTCWIMIPAMLIAMFADDFVKAFLPKEFDLPTRIIYIICIVLFALDLVALSILDETYLFSLCFWLDFVGTLSLIPFVLHAFRRNFIVARVWKIAEYLCRATKKLEKAKFYNIFQAGRLLKLGLTMLTLSLIAVLSFFLSWDSNKLLIEPIERMVYFIKELADNPGSFAGKFNPQQTSSLRSGQVMETRMLEGALVKIASLSKVALGDAGMDIISVNLKGAEFNPMVPGKKVRACFGFCDIRNFTDATECLQEDVMMFVNKIADVVHNKVSAHNGFPNKNIGDAFLIVWKKTLSDGAFKSKGSSFADRALRSFLDVIQALETSQTLKEFAMHPAIQQRMPGYRIHMGFGLHVGWAIEGAIGSLHKVDTSYLSPHVNMASRLEAATKQYGVMILISETVVASLTKNSLRDSCRKIDRVTVKGSVEPLTLYTYDMPMFQTDLRILPQDYKSMFEAGVESYIAGNWHFASEKLHDCLQVWPSDMPAKKLLEYLNSHKNMIPMNWKGYRELSEK